MDGPGIYTALCQRDRLLREALTVCLTAQPDLIVTGAVQSLTDLERLCRLRPVDVALIDLHRSFTAAKAKALAALRATNGRLTVVLTYAALSTKDITAAATGAGTTHLLPRSRGIDALISAVRNAAGPQARSTVRRAGLTARDMEVICLMGAGYSVREMARKMGITPSTVENHKRRIFAKFSANSQTAAVGRAADLGLLGATNHDHGTVRVALAPRELDILRAIATGHSIRQTATALGITTKTVENTRARLFSKLAVRNSAQALAVAYGLGLVADADCRAFRAAADHGGCRSCGTVRSAAL